MISKLEAIGDPQVAYHLLRVCLGACRGIFLLRLLPFEFGQSIAAELSKGLRDSLSNIVGQQLDDEHWALASFCLKSGGLGIQDPVHVHAGAYVAARLSAVARSASAPDSISNHISDTLAKINMAPRALAW